MNNKILFADLDHTLLCDDKSISEKNRAAIQKMLERGHYFVLATGRPVESGRIVAKDLGLTSPGCYMIAFNGAVVYDCAADRVLHKSSLPIEVTQEIFDRAHKAGIYVQTYNTVDIVTKRHTKELDYYVERSHMTYKLTRRISDCLDSEPQKVILIHLEDCPVNTDKGTGAQYLVKLLNIPHTSTVAIGDEQNDIPMIQSAHIGIAMKNGIDDIKKAADYVTENDNNHDAIAEVIEKFIL